MYSALAQSQGGTMKVSFLRNFFRGCGLLKDPIVRAKLDVMLQQYPSRRTGRQTPRRAGSFKRGFCIRVHRVSFGFGAGFIP